MKAAVAIFGVAMLTAAVCLHWYGVTRPHPRLKGDDLARVEAMMSYLGPAYHAHEMPWVVSGLVCGVIGFMSLVSLAH